MKLILLNGPPRSGKDTAAKALIDKLGATHEKFSAPLKLAFAGMMGVKISDDFVVDHYEAMKETTIPLLGVSFRQWQIDFSETFMKPSYGNNVFAKLLIERLHNRWLGDDASDRIAVISDCGFQIEVDGLLERMNKRDVLILKIIREGCSFEGDSRQWVDGHGRFQELTVYNDATVASFGSLVNYKVETWRKHNA